VFSREYRASSVAVSTLCLIYFGALMEKEKEEEGEITVKFGFILGTAA
jgi:hypothetical protein